MKTILTITKIFLIVLLTAELSFGQSSNQNWVIPSQNLIVKKLNRNELLVKNVGTYSVSVEINSQPPIILMPSETKRFPFHASFPNVNKSTLTLDYGTKCFEVDSISATIKMMGKDFKLKQSIPELLANPGLPFAIYSQNCNWAMLVIGIKFLNLFTMDEVNSKFRSILSDRLLNEPTDREDCHELIDKFPSLLQESYDETEVWLASKMESEIAGHRRRSNGIQPKRYRMKDLIYTREKVSIGVTAFYPAYYKLQRLSNINQGNVKNLKVKESPYYGFRLYTMLHGFSPTRKQNRIFDKYLVGEFETTPMMFNLKADSSDINFNNKNSLNIQNFNIGLGFITWIGKTRVFYEAGPSFQKVNKYMFDSITYKSGKSIGENSFSTINIFFKLGFKYMLTKNFALYTSYNGIADPKAFKKEMNDFFISQQLNIGLDMKLKSFRGF